MPWRAPSLHSSSSTKPVPMTLARRRPCKPRESSPRGRPAHASNGLPRPTPTAQPGRLRPKPPGTQLRRRRCGRGGLPPSAGEGDAGAPHPGRRRACRPGGRARTGRRPGGRGVCDHRRRQASHAGRPRRADPLSAGADRGAAGSRSSCERLDSLLRDPPPTPRVVDDPGPFFHGTKADLRPGDLLTPGWRSNYGSGRQAKHIYLTATRDGRATGCRARPRRGARPGIPGRATRHDRGRPERHRQALPRQPDPVLPHDRATAGRRGDHGLEASSARDDPAPARAHGRAGRARDRGDGRLTAAAPPLVKLLRAHRKTGGGMASGYPAPHAAACGNPQPCPHVRDLAVTYGLLAGDRDIPTRRDGSVIPRRALERRSRGAHRGPSGRTPAGG